MKVIVCVTGMPGAGKSVIAKYLAENLPAKSISMGDVMREEAKERGLGLDLESMMRFAKQIREELGPAAVAKLVIKRLGEIKDIVVIDGVRSLHEIEYFSKYAPVVVVAVHASPRERFRRLKNRGRKDDPKKWEDFAERDLKELEIGIGNVIALADVMVVNEGREVSIIKSETLQRVREVLKVVSAESK